jgi:hypothetical protein
MTVKTARTQLTIYCASQRRSLSAAASATRMVTQLDRRGPRRDARKDLRLLQPRRPQDIRRLHHCGYHLPSLSSGDIIIRQIPTGTRYYVVAHFGFTNISQHQYLAIRRARDPQLAAWRYVSSHN